MILMILSKAGLEKELLSNIIKDINIPSEHIPHDYYDSA
jgi:hypothetical protein